MDGVGGVSYRVGPTLRVSKHTEGAVNMWREGATH